MMIQRRNMMAQVAVLVDGDNIHAWAADAVLSAMRAHGTGQVLRVYTDVSRLSGWDAHPQFQLIHAGSGKNAADVMLAIEAMDLLHSGQISTFVLVSSDSDFTHLARRLRSGGAQVVGLGEAKTKDSFRTACSIFHEIAKLCDRDAKICSVVQGDASNAGMPITQLGAKMYRDHSMKVSDTSEGNWRAYLSARPDLFDLDPKGPHARVRLKT